MGQGRTLTQPNPAPNAAPPAQPLFIPTPHPTHPHPAPQAPPVIYNPNALPMYRDSAWPGGGRKRKADYEAEKAAQALRTRKPDLGQAAVPGELGRGVGGWGSLCVRGGSGCAGLRHMCGL